ncbi:hypothetical protein HORM4_490029 [Vibrio harveyi]|nr:hypothetical protein HORM4_490029 [Vibrio harveyi]
MNSKFRPGYQTTRCRVCHLPQGYDTSKTPYLKVITNLSRFKLLPKSDIKFVQF